MESFSTRIVRTWSPSPLLRGIMVVFLMGGGAILYVFEVQEHWLRISASVVYFASMFGALSLSFIRPKNLGEITISKSGIDSTSERVFRKLANVRNSGHRPI